MPHVVTEACILCKYTDCVDVCPVDSFHEDKNMLFINPDECIDCGVCAPECPVDAIYADEDLPEELLHFVELNAEMVKKLPLITRKKEALPDAEKWKDVKDKMQYL